MANRWTRITTISSMPNPLYNEHDRRTVKRCCGRLPYVFSLDNAAEQRRGLSESTRPAACWTRDTTWWYAECIPLAAWRQMNSARCKVRIIV